MDERNFIINSIQGTLSSISSNEEVIEFSDTTFEFDEDKHVKLENNELADILNYSLSKIPDIVVATSNIANVEQVNRVVSDGVFKVVFKNGVTDQSISNLCKNSEGLLTTVYRDSNGFNQAGLSNVGKEITDKMSTIKAANVVNGIMAVASIAVGCHYMHSIDNKLDEMNQKIESLITRDDDEKISELNAIRFFFCQALFELEENDLNEMQIEHYHSIIQNQSLVCLKISDFYKRQLENTIKHLASLQPEGNLRLFDFGKKSSINIVNDYEKIMRYHMYMSYADSIYIATTIAEIIMSKNYSSCFLCKRMNDLKCFRDNQEHDIKKMYDIYPREVRVCNEFVEKCNKLDDRFADFNEQTYMFIDEKIDELNQYANSIINIQTKQFDVYCHNNELYINKTKYLEAEEK